jgi:hypothetical protein
MAMYSFFVSRKSLSSGPRGEGAKVLHELIKYMGGTDKRKTKKNLLYLPNCLLELGILIGVLIFL